MTIRPWESTPPDTGEIWGRPSRRAVTSSNRWRVRTKSSSSASSTVRLVAMDLATKAPYSGESGGLFCSWRGLRWLLGDVRGCPGCKERQCVVCGAVGLGGVGDDDVPGLGGQLEDVVVEGEVADQGVVEWLNPGAVLRHVVRCPAGAEVLAAQCQVSDEGGQGGVVRVASCFCPQAAHRRGRDALPVGVVAACPGVEEDVPGEVDRAAALGEDGGVEGVAEVVGGEDVEA